MKTLHVNDITPEALFEARRHFLKLGAGALVSSSALSQLMASLPKDLSLTYTPDTNPLKLTLNTEEQATNYVNFYEFSTDKTAPVKLSQKMKTSPWNVGFFGELKTEQMLEVDDLIAKFGLEERIYRFRCVEGWSMVVPWIGFPLYKLLDYLEPNSKAKYVKFTTRHEPSMFPNRSFKSDRKLTSFKKFSSFIFQAKAKEGKVPQRFPSAKREEPSQRMVKVNR